MIVAVADIETSGGEEYIFNIPIFVDSEVDFYASIWGQFFPTRRLQLLSTLPLAPGESEPIQLLWRMNSDGLWYNPELAGAE